MDRRRRVRLIACGNPHAGDDALGLVAAEALRDRLPPGVEVVEAGESTRVLDLLGDVDTVIMIDAVRASGAARAPGTVLRAEGDAAGLADVRGSLSSHGLGLAEAVGLALALGEVPRVIFHGIEVAHVRMGVPLSPPVAAALPELVDAVLEDVAREVAQ